MTRQPSFMVGGVPVYGRVILAPMSGYSDMPFRAICARLGSAMSYTEFVAAGAIRADVPQAWQRLRYAPDERPVVFQIFDHNEDWLDEAARQIEALGPDIIDLNMGCSVDRVALHGAGAGLLRTPEKAGRIIARLRKAVSVPVTAKIRLGWDANSRNYLQVARILEDSGAALIAVHGRTRSQGYRGGADWDAIAEIRQQVRVPVIGNGDVTTPDDIDRMLAHTGVDGVMIGRAAIGNPWIFQRRTPDMVPYDEKVRMIREHLRASVNFYGEQEGTQLFKRHVPKYLRGVPGVRQVRADLDGADYADRIVALIEQHTRALASAA